MRKEMRNRKRRKRERMEDRGESEGGGSRRRELWRWKEKGGRESVEKEGEERVKEGKEMYPMVEMKLGVKESSVKRIKSELLPTAEQTRFNHEHAQNKEKSQ